MKLQVETQPGERLDRWLTNQMPELSRSRIQTLISAGHIQVNGAASRASTLVQLGDAIEVVIPDPVKLDLVAQEMNLAIIYEDDDLLVLNKPVGLVVHPSSGHATDTLVHGLLAHCQDLSGINGTERPGIVHRLDKDTSGLLVVAKQDIANQHLQLQLQAKTMRRAYLGVVHGQPQTAQGTVDAPIGRHPKDRQRMAVVPTGRAARTHWQVIERLGNYVFMHFDLETGRTHQIRVHMQHLGHPLVGDTLYGRGKSPIPLPGQALHAYRLEFSHPTSGERLSFRVNPPDHFLCLLQGIGAKTLWPSGSTQLKR